MSPEEILAVLDAECQQLRGAATFLACEMKDPKMAEWVNGAVDKLAALRFRIAKAGDISQPAAEPPRLDHLRKLQQGWDSYRAPVIDERAIRVAEAILSTPGQAIPTVRGGVQIEWHVGGVDVEITILRDGTIKDEAVQPAAEPEADSAVVQIAEAVADEARRIFKGRAPETETLKRADPYADGFSDGAGEVAQRLRAAMRKEAEAQPAAKSVQRVAEKHQIPAPTKEQREQALDELTGIPARQPAAESAEPEPSDTGPRCESCDAPATCEDVDGVPLCEADYADLVASQNKQITEPSDTEVSHAAAVEFARWVAEYDKQLLSSAAIKGLAALFAAMRKERQ